jgi:hypothetical protein
MMPQLQQHLSNSPSSTTTNVQTSSRNMTAVLDEDEDEDEDDEFHDSGDFLENCTNASSVDGLKPNFANIHATNSNPNTSPVGAKSKSSPGSSDVLSNRLQEVATKFFEAVAKLDLHSPLHNQRDKIAEILPLDHLG